MDFDWDAIEDWFVNNSGNMTYRQVSAESGNLPCFGHQICSHEKIREKGKEGLWMQKRTEQQAKQHGGIIGDYQASYDIITKTLNERFEELSPTEMASLGNLQIKYGEVIMALNPPQRDSDIEVLTRDDIMRISGEIIDEIMLLENVDPLTLLHEETPGAQPVSDEGTDQMQ